MNNYFFYLLLLFITLPFLSKAQYWEENIVLSGDEVLGGVHRVESADLDQDGDLEILIEGNDISYFDNLGGGNFGPKTVITSDWETSWGSNLNVYDKDGDGDLDILGIRSKNNVVWYVNNGTAGFSVEVIGTFTYEVESVSLGDLDGDGDMDVASSTNDLGLGQYEQVKWFENVGGSYTEYEIDNAVELRKFTYIADIDGDSDNDIITGIREMWVYRNDGSGNFSSAVYWGNAGYDITTLHLEDLNGDNLPDLLVSDDDYGDNRTAWLRNTGSSFAAEEIIRFSSTNASYGLAHAYPFDMDGDGDLDVIDSESYYEKISYFNNDGSGNFTLVGLVTQNDNNSFYYNSAGDLNNDGYPDVITYYDTDPTSGFNDHISWFDAAPNFDATLTFILCKDNGTPLDTSDDYIRIGVNIFSQSLSGQFNASSGASPSSGTTGLASFDFPAGSAGNGDITFTLSDAADPSYNVVLNITDPGTCQGPIDLFTELSNVRCNNNGTIGNFSDDFVQFDLRVTGHTGSYSVSQNGNTLLNPSGGAYGAWETFSMAPGTTDMGTLYVAVRDDIYPTMATESFAIPEVSSCSENSSGCNPPNNVIVGSITSSSSVIAWNEVVVAIDYNLEYREIGASSWTTIVTSGTSYSLSSLLSCTEYELRVSTNCIGGETTWFSDIVTFTTIDCGQCIDGNYCFSRGDDSDYEWIAKVELGDIDNVTSNDGGYGDFTNISTDIGFGRNYSITLEPGFSGTLYNEYFKVWIDYNQDDDFDDDGELVFDPGAVTQTAITGNFTVPSDAAIGSTRMRVTMQFEDPIGSSCESVFDYGEVEDYCVSIVDPAVSNEDVLNLDYAISPNPVKDILHVQFGNSTQGRVEVDIFSVDGRVVKTISTSQLLETFDLDGLSPGVYVIRFTNEGKISTAKFVKH